MIKRLLIANRGEIALRIIRACKELGIRSIAVYSEADVQSLHVQLADEAICIGPAPSPQSYLKIDRIISAAEIADADAIHPGYGFLAENAHFAEVCASCKIKFVGPSPEAIRLMGDKNMARQQAIKAGVPVTPGSDGIVETEGEALRVARKIGFPVMVKAVAGGGGRGMRIAHNEVTLVKGFHSARTEADKAFGNPAVYIEKFVVNPHHIEFQLIADNQGNVVHLGERDCSVQRRNQKIIEECPSPIMTDKLRKKMGEASVALAKAVNYENAGTIEFLVDEDRNFYFMEMNTRIQVEHPITEEVYGVDLVKQQLQIASGQPLSHHVLNAVPRHHSIECRINAEDPDNNFMPSPGTIDLYYAPGGRGVRIDSHAYAGYPIPPNYDSMISKLIVHASTREQAIARMRRALGEYMITGIKTTIPLQLEIMQNKDFMAGKYDTGFLERMLAERGAPKKKVSALADARLYGIVDLGYVTADTAPVAAEKLLEGGVDILQLRAKGVPKSIVAELAGEIHALTAPLGVPLILNDYPELLRDVPAEGAHVGQDDLSVAEARAAAGRPVIIGKSTHSLAQARAAAEEGADYIGFGPLFATPTKPGRPAIGLQDITAVHDLISIPIFCIGGIKNENLPEVIAAGARRVVIVSGWLQAGDIADAVRAARNALWKL